MASAPPARSSSSAAARIAALVNFEGYGIANTVHLDSRVFKAYSVRYQEEHRTLWRKTTSLSYHGQYLTRLTRLGLINCYLISEPDGLTLIDTAIAGTEKQLAKAAAQLGQPIRRIVLTHAHGDHVGSLDALHALYPGAEVMISKRDARLLRGDASLDADEAQDKVRGSLQTVTTEPTRLLGDGDSIGSLRAVASPGHTPGHMAFFDTRDNSLIAGDAFVTQGGLAVSGQMRWLFPLPHLATWHAPTALASAKKLVALEPSRLAVGHGPVLEQPSAPLKRVCEQFSRKLAGR